MDPFSAVVGTLQIAGQCAQVTVALARYINQVLTVDQRVKDLYDDVAKLQATYEALEQCRSSPQLVRAAKAADEVNGQLWSHLATTLRDCENTLVAINHLLSKINRPLGAGAQIRRIFEAPIKQLQEQLHGGELGRHHERIRMFNTSLALPMQMINITLQLGQRELSEEHQKRLENRLVDMQNTIEHLHKNIAKLKQPQLVRRGTALSDGTLVEAMEPEKVVWEHMETFANRASLFLSSASNAAASTRSGASTVHPDLGIPFKGSSEKGMPLTRGERKRISAWVPMLQEETNLSSSDSESTPSPNTEHGDHDTDDEDFELELARTYFENGQDDLNKVDFADAEENFLEALKIMQNHDFGERLAFHTDDIVLMLTHCYIEQSKYDEAIELLLPLTEGNEDDDTSHSVASSSRSQPSYKARKHSDRGRGLAAHHCLGNVYLRKQDFQSAEKHSLFAFKGRRKLFGKTHEKTIESAQLVVDMYTAKGERAKARAYSKNVNPDADHNPRTPEQEHRASFTSILATSPRPAVVRKPLAAERAAAAAVSPPIFASPPIVTNNGSSRKISNEMHVSESHSTHIPQSPGRTSVFDDTSTISSVTRSSVPQSLSTTTSKHFLKPRFDAVKSAAVKSKDKACEGAHHLLIEYDPEPSSILVHRWHDIKKNIKKHGAEKGLAATGFGYAPIHFFCELKEEHVTEVELLLDEGVDLLVPRYKAGYGKEEPMTPLQLAIDKNHQNIAALIIDALEDAGISAMQVGAMKDRDELSPLLRACRLGQVEIVSRLLEHGVNVLSGFPRVWCGNSLLHDACSRCDFGMVHLLLTLQSRQPQRWDIGSLNQQDQFGRTPLMYAVISKNIHDHSKRSQKLRGRLRCVKLLLQHAGEDLPAHLAIFDSHKRGVMGYTQEEGDEELLSLLREYGAEDHDGHPYP